MSDAGSKSHRPMVAIIIDDLGYKLSLGRDSAALPWPVTLSIIPFTPHAKHLAELAHNANKEVMVHAPMETMTERPWEPGLIQEMTEQEFVALGRDMLAAVPYATGLNNHGGSLLTASQDHMNWLMHLLHDQQFFFIDSRTSSDSLAEELARKNGVATESRDIFLDNVRDPQAVMAQLDRLEAIARKHGYAIGIGHPHPETLIALQAGLPAMQERGIVLVPVSTLLEESDYRRRLASQTVHPQ